MKFNIIKHFTDTYIDKHFRVDFNKINLSKADGYFHNLRVCEICCKLIQEKNVKFLTQAKLKCGSKPDIIFFRGNIPYIIEVRNTENDKRSEAKLKKLPYEIREFVHYIDANKPLKEELCKIK